MPKFDFEKELRKDDDKQPKPQKRPMVCDVCGSSEMSTEMDVGYDVDESGEEEQHEDTCKCGAKRMWCKVFPFQGGRYVTWGKFHKEELS